jgi:hypothetical protein
VALQNAGVALKPATYPFLQVLLFGLILFCKRPLIVEHFVSFLTELIDTVH